MASNDEWYLENQPKPSLRMWIFQNMALGAIYAAGVLTVVIAFILILKVIGGLLPEDPFATLETMRNAAGRLA